jgi:chromosome segregation ATPase
MKDFLLNLIKQWQEASEEAVKLRFQLRDKKLELIEMESEADTEVAFNEELKNEGQRKAKRWELLQQKGWKALQREINELERDVALKEIEAEKLSRELRVHMTYGKEEGE